MMLNGHRVLTPLRLRLPLTSGRWTALTVLFVSLFAHASQAALTADQILLITNQNEPESLKLAELYTAERHIPDHRILQLDLPVTDEMAAEQYDQQVVPAVRSFIRENHLERQITCIVTFYGVPLRIAARKNSPEDIDELAKLKAKQGALAGKVEPLVAALEHIAIEVDPTLKPDAGGNLDVESRRAEIALQHLTTAAAKMNADDREKLQIRTTHVIEPLIGSMGLLERSLKQQLAATTRSASQPATQPAGEALAAFLRFRNTALALREKPYEAESRAKLRELVRRYLGPFEYARVLQAHIEYLQVDSTTAAFDSELSLLWWEYPKYRWMGNALRYGQPSIKGAALMMVMRLDAPTPAIVRQIISDSLRVEAAGLQGGVVLDSRGLGPVGANKKPDPYGVYDQTIRNLAALLRSKSKLQVVLDERPELLAANSLQNVAVYMGWYDVNNYIPACKFNPGSVGFHLASFTLTSLHSPSGGAWCRGMLTDGIAATLGPVAEPYVQAFPNADDFFPLLFTGKLTLAEVYWRSTPMTSWMISMIGDPLYTPYKTNPALTVNDLPKRLQSIFVPAESPTTLPGR
jgi:uncharacterized protein (TIGR03790 family)